MTLPASILASIQKVGAAAFDADSKLKAATKEYAERVSAAVMEGPDAQGTDALIERWRTLGRLSKAMESIEEELKKVHQLASQLAPHEPSGVGRSAAPTRSTAAVVQAPKAVAKTATSAAVKPSKVKTKASKRKSPAGAPKTLMPTSNPARLLQHLAPMLSASEFTVISQTAAAKATGIPLGSMTAAIKKLVEAGQLVTGPKGALKLTNAAPIGLATAADPVKA